MTIDEVRARAVEKIEATLTRAERVATGAEEAPSDWEGDRMEFARALKERTVAYIQFAAGIGLCDYVRDRDLLLGWAQRGGAIK